jgi:hypothetical protein
VTDNKCVADVIRVTLLLIIVLAFCSCCCCSCCCCSCKSLQALTALGSLIPTVTEKEALCVGVFLTLMLQALQVWVQQQQ